MPDSAKGHSGLGTNINRARTEVGDRSDFWFLSLGDLLDAPGLGQFLWASVSLEQPGKMINWLLCVGVCWFTLREIQHLLGTHLSHVYLPRHTQG